MTHLKICTLILLACALCAHAASPTPDPVRLLAATPLRFEPSSGRFIAQGLRYRFQFEGNQVRFAAGAKSGSLRFERSSPGPQLEGLQPLRSHTSRLIGNDRSKWEKNVPNFAQLEAHGLYRGIDAVYYGNAGELEYDLHVHPGADPRQIRLRFTGAKAHIDAAGNLVADFIQKKPVTYQTGPHGERVAVESRYRAFADGSFGIELGRYDRNREVVIDPVLVFTAYVAGSLSDSATSIGHDAQGFLYVGGTTFSTDLSVTVDAVQSASTGTPDVFVAKLDPTATDPNAQLVYLTYLGGSGADTLRDMVVTRQGYVYLAGTTASADFPLANAAQSALGGTTDAFVAWLIPAVYGIDGLYYSTYLGGTTDDTAYGIAVDTRGKIYVTGFTTSTDFPVTGGTSNAGGQDAFVAQIDTAQGGASTLVYASYLGGSNTDAGRAIAVAADGSVWVTGSTASSDFPMAGSGYQQTYQPGGDVFVAQINPLIYGSSSLTYSTFLGGRDQDIGKRIIVDPSGRVIVGGLTNSPDFPTTLDAYQPYLFGQSDVFLVILDPTRKPSSQLIYSTYFGGSQPEVLYDLKLDSAGVLYLTGSTSSSDMPVTVGSALQPLYDGNGDAFIVKLDPSQPGLAGLVYSTYVGSVGTQIGYAIDVDALGNIYLAGYTTGPLLDALGGATKMSAQGNADAFVLGFSVCSISISTGSYQFPTGGGSDSIGVNVTGGNCGWTASSTLDWVTLSPAGGNGSGSVTITVAANRTGAPRQGTITVAGNSFLVGQDQ